MTTWLESITSPLSAASEGIQKLMEVRDFLKFGDALGKLQAQILAAQQGALAAHARESALLEEIRELKKRIAEIEAWDAEIKRYQLVNLIPGFVTLMLKESERSKEPAHYICADCAASGKKFYLQKHVSGPRYDEYRCGGCGAKIGVDKDIVPPPYGPLSGDWSS